MPCISSYAPTSFCGHMLLMSTSVPTCHVLCPQHTLEALNSCLAVKVPIFNQYSDVQLLRYGPLGVEWVDAAWKQGARQTVEQNSEPSFSEAALRKCGDILRENELPKVQVAHVNNNELKWKATRIQSAPSSPTILAHVNVANGGHLSSGSDITKLTQLELETLNPYIARLAEGRTLVYDSLET
jgi:hypothetical protein